MLVTTGLSKFCQSTGLHGFAYLPSDRHWAEVLFWATAVIASVCWVAKICLDSFLLWSGSPVINVVETYNYDAAKVKNHF